MERRRESSWRRKTGGGGGGAAVVERRGDVMVCLVSQRRRCLSPPLSLCAVVVLRCAVLQVGCDCVRQGGALSRFVEMDALQREAEQKEGQLLRFVALTIASCILVLLHTGYSSSSHKRDAAHTAAEQRRSAARTEENDPGRSTQLSPGSCLSPRQPCSAVCSAGSDIGTALWPLWRLLGRLPRRLRLHAASTPHSSRPITAAP